MNTFITILGIVLLITPYILIWKSEDKIKTFLTVFTYTTLANIVVALITQSLHIFNYYTVLFCQIVVVTYCLYLFRYKQHKRVEHSQASHASHTSHTPHTSKAPFRSTSSFASGLFSRVKLSKHVKSLKGLFFPLAFFALAIYLLSSIHFNYTGFVDTVFGLQKVSHSSYVYPMYSDEWIGASFIDYSVRTGSLPLVNTLNGDTPFPNFLFISHSLFAHTVVLLGLDVVSNYIYFAILNTLLICIAMYLILRHFKVRVTISAITAFSVLLLTNGGNLPGLWSLLPYSASLMFLMYSILSHIMKLEKVALVNMLIALIVYPPMLVFIVPIWIAYYGFKKFDFKHIKYKKIVLNLCVFLGAVLLFASLFVSKGFSFSEIYTKVFSYIVRESLDQGRVYYALWNVMPVFMTPFAILGLFLLFKQKIKILMYPISVGIFLWIVYCFVNTVYLIEPARVVVITSVFMIIGLGLGLEKSYSYIQHKTKGTFFDLTDPILDTGIKILVFGFFVFWTINIGRFGLWHRLPLYFERNIFAPNGVIQSVPQKIFPAPPITRYLQEDDIKLFSNFSEKRFVSPQWKGLVLGVATHNYPLDSKPSMVTNNILSYDAFNLATCAKKQKYINTHKIDLVYSASTTCAGFKEIGKSSENLYLYSVNSK